MPSDKYMAVVHQPPEVHEDLAPYAGSWVAIRDGVVIANALDPLELRDDPRVRDDDMLMPVPDDTSGIFVL